MNITGNGLRHYNYKIKRLEVGTKSYFYGAGPEILY